MWSPQIFEVDYQFTTLSFQLFLSSEYVLKGYTYDIWYKNQLLPPFWDHIQPCKEKWNLTEGLVYDSKLYSILILFILRKDNYTYTMGKMYLLLTHMLNFQSLNSKLILNFIFLVNWKENKNNQINLITQRYFFHFLFMFNFQM